MNTSVVRSAFDLMAGHIGHQVELVGYGKGGKPPWVDLALECHDCDTVIADWTELESPKRRKKNGNRSRRSHHRSE